ncbi:uncharacterized protein STEHIDRAFT_110320 [Stereum hirsutum FP-91666 SS1]|uniref:uncharacterized protein n=1 Tax=Stereum hirsutum (strain FP-91666) TaxID=721885 RepID=UPI000440AA1B|nr:uncharacterized protein STEHIDRAFT_110320 [Stereum hirsutum FP-91666 SS1]EIM86999.1 hypothetical protein STEHIDRAFT_110320 [Stereum hirsutum FP-91666 SS1]
MAINEKLEEYSSQKHDDHEGPEYLPPPPSYYENAPDRFVGGMRRPSDEKGSRPPHGSQYNTPYNSSPSGTTARGLNDQYFSPPASAPPYQNQYAAPSYPPPDNPQYLRPTQSYSGPSTSNPHHSYSPSTPSSPNLRPSTSHTPSADTTNSAYPGFTYAGKAPAQRDPFNPPPSCFSRTPPPPSPTTPYTPLPHMLRIRSANASDLASGFLPIFPSPPLLIAHDVQPSDVSRLLEDCHLMGKLSVGQHVVSGVAPILMHLGFAGFFVGNAMKKGMKRRKVESVKDLVKVWDDEFFRPRGLRIWVQRGDMAGTPGGMGMAPGMAPGMGMNMNGGGMGYGPGPAPGMRPTREQWRASGRHDADYDSSSSSDSSDSDSDSGHGHKGKGRADEHAHGHGDMGMGGGRPGMGMGPGFGGGLGGRMAMSETMFDRRTEMMGGGGGRAGMMGMGMAAPMSRREAKWERREMKREMRSERREMKRERRGERRQDKTERRAMKRERKVMRRVERTGPVYLVIANA